MGSAGYLQELKTTTNEKEFVRSLIDYITGLDSRITCEDDVDTEYSDSDLTNVPQFHFLFNGEDFFDIKRGETAAGRALSEKALAFSVSLNSSDVRQLNVYFSTDWSAGTYTQIMARAVRISHIVSSDFVLINFQGISGYSGAVQVISTSSNVIYRSYWSTPNNPSKSDIFDISSRTFYSTEIGGPSGVFLSRFTYKSMPGKIDYIQSSIYASSGTKVFELTGVRDCTTVILGETVSLKDGAYIAVGSNQLVKLT